MVAWCSCRFVKCLGWCL